MLNADGIVYVHSVYSYSLCVYLVRLFGVQCTQGVMTSYRLAEGGGLRCVWPSGSPEEQVDSFHRRPRSISSCQFKIQQFCHKKKSEELVIVLVLVLHQMGFGVELCHLGYSTQHTHHVGPLPHKQGIQEIQEIDSIEVLKSSTSD